MQAELGVAAGQVSETESRLVRGTPRTRVKDNYYSTSLCHVEDIRRSLDVVSSASDGLRSFMKSATLRNVTVTAMTV